MTDRRNANQDQKALWDGAAGEAWVEMQRVLDELLEPFNRVLLEHALRERPNRVLDVGCGAGSTTLSVARHLGSGGSCVGVDLSTALIEVARQRAIAEKAGNVTFVHADAQTHRFEANSFDAVISRFGVMFFEDPVAAFANLRHAARSESTLTFVAWRSPGENPFMTTAARAAAPFLPSLPTPDLNGPGQFGLADPGRVRHMLDASGWQNVDIGPIDVPSSVAHEELLSYVTRLGPVGLALKEVDEPTRVKVTAAVHAAFDPYIQDGAARFTAACWLVRARG